MSYLIDSSIPGRESKLMGYTYSLQSNLQWCYRKATICLRLLKSQRTHLSIQDRIPLHTQTWTRDCPGYNLTASFTSKLPYLRVIPWSRVCWSSSFVSFDSPIRNSSTSWIVRRLLAAGGQDLLSSKKMRTVSETSPCLQKQTILEFIKGLGGKQNKNDGSVGMKFDS